MIKRKINVNNVNNNSISGFTGIKKNLKFKNTLNFKL